MLMMWWNESCGHHMYSLKLLSLWWTDFLIKRLKFFSLVFVSQHLTFPSVFNIALTCPSETNFASALLMATLGKGKNSKNKEINEKVTEISKVK